MPAFTSLATFQTVLDGLPTIDIVAEQGALARNSLAATVFWAITAVLSIIGAAYWQSTPVLATCAAGFCVLYVIAYRRLI